MNKIFFIGIAGSTASGKTYFANNLVKRFGDDNAALLPLDSYYHNRDDLSFEEREKINYDPPSAFEINLLIDHINQLKNQSSVNVPIYDYSNHRRSDSFFEVKPKKIIIIEGILALHFDELVKEFNYKIHIDTPIDICLERRIARDISERSRTKESVLHQWEKTVLPMYLQYVEPHQDRADLILSGVENLDKRIIQIHKIINSL